MFLFIYNETIYGTDYDIYHWWSSMQGVFSLPGTFRKFLGPSTLLPLLAVILVVLSVSYIPAAHAEGEAYTVDLDPNGGSWTSEGSGSFTVSVGEQVTLPSFEGTVPDGTVFAGWSLSDGYTDGHYVQYTQTLDFQNKSTFKMTSELAGKTSGSVLKLYAIWIPKLTTLPQGKVLVEQVYKTGDTVTVDLRLPQDLTAGTYELTAGSVPYFVPTEEGSFQFSVENGICTVNSSELFPGTGNIRVVIPAVYSAAGGTSDTAYVLVEWILDLTFIETLMSANVI